MIKTASLYKTQFYNFFQHSIYALDKIYFEFSVWQTTNLNKIICAIERPNLYNFAKS